MSTRILIEFNTDYFANWPPEVKRLIFGDAEMFKRHGIKKKWERHHQDECPVEHYLKERVDADTGRVDVQSDEESSDSVGE